MTKPGLAGYVVREPATAAPTDATNGVASGLACALGAPLAEALRLAAMAPSPHNTQPWLVLVHDARRWSITLAPDRRLPAIDPADRNAVLAVGAFLENLSIAGEAIGYQVEVERYGEVIDDPALVSLHLTRCKGRGGTEAIPRRRTLRHAFVRRPPERRDLEALCADLDGLAWIPANSRTGDSIRDIVVGATASQVGRDEALAELADWLRTRPGAQDGDGAGVSADELELGGLVTWLTRHIPGERIVLSRVFRRSLVDRASRLALHCGGWLLLSSADGSIPALVDAGRRLERLYLRARSLGLGMHPMNQPLQEAGWRQDLERTTGVRGFPRMLLRLGYTDRWPARGGARLAPDAFTHLLG